MIFSRKAVAVSALLASLMLSSACAGAGNTTTTNTTATGSTELSTVTGQNEEDPMINPENYVKGIPTYAEAYRQQYHYSCRKSWMNDINGTVYFNGVWHMYYQCNYNVASFGDCYWGHATSTDLVHWEEHEPAISPDSNQIWSGTAWADNENRSGLFTDGKGGIIAAYSTEKQTVGIAYSEDGMKFKKIGIVIKNPGPGMVDFRDPKLFYDETNGRWTILVAGGKVRIYQSDDLKNWTLTSENDIWTECPDFFPLKDEKGNEKWVLSCAGRAFYVGSYEKGKFTPESDLIVTNVGPDSYAAITFENSPDGRRLMVGWMNRWEYAQETGTEWVSNASLAAELKLTHRNGKYSVDFLPVNDYDLIVRERIVDISNKKISAGEDLLSGKSASLLRLNIKIDLKETTDFILKAAVGDGDATVLRYSKAKNSFVFDRSNSVAGCEAISKRNPISSVKRSSDGDLIELTVFIDTAGFEMFVDNCEYFAALIRPQSSSKGMSLTTDGSLSVVALTVDELSGIWFEDDSKVYSPQVSTGTVMLELENPTAVLTVGSFGGNKKIHCTSADESVATASIDGHLLKITAKKAGKTTICVRVGDHYVALPVNVHKKNPCRSMIGNFSVSGGSLKMSEKGILLTADGWDAFAMSDSEGGDFEYETGLMLNAGTNAAALMFRMSSMSDFYCVCVDAASGGVKLWMKKGGNVKDLKWVSVSGITAGKSYHLGIKAVGDDITVTLDGKELFAVKDSSHSYGSFGLNCCAGSAFFNDIKYTLVGTDIGKPDSDMTFTVMGGKLTTCPDGYKFTNSSGDAFARGDRILSDFVYSADISVDSGSVAGALAFRLTDSDNFYCLSFSRGEGIIKLWKRDGGYTTVLKTVNVSIEAGKFYNLTVGAVGEDITVTLDGRKLFVCKDGSHDYGSLGINVFNGSAIFNHIRVTEK